jgi:hypothetical protein
LITQIDSVNNLPLFLAIGAMSEIITFRKLVLHYSNCLHPLCYNGWQSPLGKEEKRWIEDKRSMLQKGMNILERTRHVGSTRRVYGLSRVKCEGGLIYIQARVLE